jgi:Uma2 family endonuclease
MTLRGMALTEPVTIGKVELSAPLLRKKFTRQEVDCLLKTDIFAGQRYELIDGDLIDKRGQAAPHAMGICNTSDWFRTFLPPKRVRVQLPVELIGEHRDLSVPEPDVSVLAEFKPEYAQRHPRSDELLLALEVSDSMAWFDLSRKAQIYASSGVPEYWVLDLNRRALVVHRQSDGTEYTLIRILSEGEMASLDLSSVGGRTETVRVSELLPAKAEESA